MRDEDAARPLLERKYRTIPHDYFLGLCNEAGGIDYSPEYLLHATCNNAREQSSIVPGCSTIRSSLIRAGRWRRSMRFSTARNAVKNLRRLNGRFTRSDLGEWVWNEAGHSVKEQELFISMMQSCGICFVHRSPPPGTAIETEYVAPEFLPERPDSELAQKWDSRSSSRDSNIRIRTATGWLDARDHRPDRTRGRSCRRLLA